MSVHKKHYKENMNFLAAMQDRQLNILVKIYYTNKLNLVCWPVGHSKKDKNK